MPRLEVIVPPTALYPDKGSVGMVVEQSGDAYAVFDPRAKFTNVVQLAMCGFFKAIAEGEEGELSPLIRALAEHFTNFQSNNQPFFERLRKP